MKSVGEVMGIGRTFEEAYQKAIRMLDLDFEGVVNEKFFQGESKEEIIRKLENPTPNRIFAISQAMHLDIPLPKIYCRAKWW